MANEKRLTRINEELMREAAKIIRSELKDPRVDTITSVTRAAVTNDLKLCKLYVSIMGDDTHKKEVIRGLESSKGFIRGLIAKRVNLRITPELSFHIDDSIDYGYKIDALIKKTGVAGDAT